MRRRVQTRLQNPPLGADWLTPRLAARLHDYERRAIRCRTRLYGAREGQLVCQDVPFEVLDLVLDHAGLDGDLEKGIVLHPGLQPTGGWPSVDQRQLQRPYGHWWIRLEDGTIVDTAASQFGERSPLVIPPGHPMQSRYVPEDPSLPELEAGMWPLKLNPYHGTRKELLRSIRREGLVRPFVSSDESQAWCWADGYAEGHGEGRVLEFDVEHPEWLIPDFNFVEPVDRERLLGVDPDAHFDVRDWLGDEGSEDALMAAADEYGRSWAYDSDCGGKASIYLGTVPWEDVRVVRRRGNPPALPRDLAPEVYVSPRERALTPKEAWVRSVAIALKGGEPWAVEAAADAMAPLVPQGAFLVPVPGHRRGRPARGTQLLAHAIRARTEAQVRNVLERRVQVPSSRDRRRSGGTGLSPRMHEHSMRATVDHRGPLGETVVLVDNVVVTGATFEGARRALWRPDAIGLAYAQGTEFAATERLK